MLSTSARLLRLITLLQTRRYWSGRDLGEHLGIDVRTVRRDVERLRDLGYPVQASAGVGGGYQLGAGADMPPVLLDDDEAIAVAVALRVAAGSIGHMEETTVRLLAKLDQLLPTRLRRRASALHAVTISLNCAYTPLSDGDLLAGLAGASRDHDSVRFGYRDHKGDASKRHVEPMRLANMGRRWYLVAWDIERADWRTFRVDRIEPPLRTGDRFVPREPPEDFATHVARSISAAPHPLQLRLRLRGSAAQLAEQIPSWCGVLEALDDMHCILSTGAETIEALVAQIVVCGVEFEVLDADELRPDLRAVIERLARGVGALAASTSMDEGIAAPSPLHP